MVTDHVKNLFDGVSVAAMLATLASWLPPLAALVSLIWGCIRIYETRTVQNWLQRKQRRKREHSAEIRRADINSRNSQPLQKEDDNAL